MSIISNFIIRKLILAFAYGTLVFLRDQYDCSQLQTAVKLYYIVSNSLLSFSKYLAPSLSSKIRTEWQQELATANDKVLSLSTHLEIYVSEKACQIM